MRIVSITRESYQRIEKEGHDINTADTKDTLAKRTEAHNKILEELNAPVELGRCEGVHHEAKSDKYQAKFTVDLNHKLTLRATNEVVEFLAMNISKAGYFRGRLENGTLVDINLISYE